MKNVYTAYWEECQKLMEAGRFEAAAEKLASAEPEEIARFLENQHRKEQQYRVIETGIKLLKQGRYKEMTAILAELEPCDTAANLLSLAGNLQELSRYADELAQGNLSAGFPDKKNYIAMSVKNLHSKMNHLVWQIGQVAHGDYNQTADYMGDLSEGFNWMTAQLLMRQSQVEYERHHDVQTGLLNRNAFMRKVYSRIEEQPDKHGAMLCGGLDNIKYINETYGHEQGDRYIAAAADIFRAYEAKDAIVARIAGDEFAVYLHGYENEVAVSLLEKELLSQLSGATVLLNEPVKIRASVGVALYPQDAMTVDNLVKFASHTMFEVKKSNRGAVMRFSAEVYQKKANEFDRQEKLNQLIEERKLRFAFQPIVRLADQSLYGYEALMRPVSNDFSGPLDVLALAEAQSKLYQIEKLTFELIFDWIYKNTPRLGDSKIFFNTVSTQFMSAAELQRIHPQYREICRRIIFEVLENAASGESFVRNIELFRRQLGVQVAIDDYGCGYSNDLRLISIAPDIVKIDRYFIKEIDKNQDKKQLLSKIVTYCQAKKIEVLAEGIETEAELNTVVQLGFTYGQGFYLGRPAFELSRPSGSA